MRVYGFNVGYAFLTLVCAAIIFTAWSASALVITPFLIVIEGRNRYADVAMVNDEDVIKNYEVNWKFYKMQEGTGNYLASETSTTEFDLKKTSSLRPSERSWAPGPCKKSGVACVLRESRLRRGTIGPIWSYARRTLPGRMIPIKRECV